MPHARPHTRKKAPKRVLALPDLEHAKSAVLSSLASRSGQRTWQQLLELLDTAATDPVVRELPHV